MTDQQQALRLRAIREAALQPFRASAELRAQYCNNEEWFLQAEGALMLGRARIFSGNGGVQRMTQAQWRQEQASAGAPR